MLLTTLLRHLSRDTKLFAIVCCLSTPNQVVPLLILFGGWMRGG